MLLPRPLSVANDGPGEVDSGSDGKVSVLFSCGDPGVYVEIVAGHLLIRQIGTHCGGIEWVCRRGARSSGQ